MASLYSSEVARNIPPVKTPDLCDIAWMAGIYEGEGCIAGIKGRTIASVHQKDPEILYRIREMFGGSITEIRKGTPRYCHVWKLYGDVARAMFQAILPYMSTRRKMQIEKAGGLRFTGMPCYREMKISDERKATRVGMTKSQLQVESVLHHKQKNLEKVKAYQRQYAAAKRLQRRAEMQSQVIQ
jgi:hypothetical protein